MQISAQGHEERKQEHNTNALTPMQTATNQKSEITTQKSVASSGSFLDPEALVREVQQLMWAKVGIVRTGQGLRDAVERLQSLTACLPQPQSRRACEARNIHTAALLIARSALARLESRGAHYRTDWPSHDDVKFKKHSVITAAGVRFV